jgi:hypothetical protein
MGISQWDRAIGLLAEYALTKCDKVAALRKLAKRKPRVIRILQSTPLRITAVLPVKKHATAVMDLDSPTQSYSPIK